MESAIIFFFTFLNFFCLHCLKLQKKKKNNNLHINKYIQEKILHPNFVRVFGNIRGYIFLLTSAESG